MTTLEIIKKLCEERGMSISGLEKEMGYGNGSLSKASKIPFDRIVEISKKFDKPLSYFINGEFDDDENIARDSTEKKLLMLCRSASEADPQKKQELVDTFESTIDIYMKAKGLK